MVNKQQIFFNHSGLSKLVKTFNSTVGDHLWIGLVTALQNSAYVSLKSQLKAQAFKYTE